MGNKLSLTKNKKPKIGVLMLGLDGSGKTSLLYGLKDGSLQNYPATIGFNHEVIEWNELPFNVWECGGHQNCRALWRHFFFGAHAIIFVIDSTDRKRLGFLSKKKSKLLVNGYIRQYQNKLPSELYDIFCDYYFETSDITAKAELYRLLKEKSLEDCKIWLILANKQDCGNAMTIADIESVLELDEIAKGSDDDQREIRIQSCSVKESMGINEAMDWLVNALRANDTSTAYTPSGMIGGAYH